LSARASAVVTIAIPTAHAECRPSGMRHAALARTDLTDWRDVRDVSRLPMCKRPRIGHACRMYYGASVSDAGGHQSCVAGVGSQSPSRTRVHDPFSGPQGPHGCVLPGDDEKDLCCASGAARQNCFIRQVSIRLRFRPICHTSDGADEESHGVSVGSSSTPTIPSR